MAQEQAHIMRSSACTVCNGACRGILLKPAVDEQKEEGDLKLELKLQTQAGVLGCRLQVKLQTLLRVPIPRCWGVRKCLLQSPSVITC